MSDMGIRIELRTPSGVYTVSSVTEAMERTHQEYVTSENKDAFSALIFKCGDHDDDNDLLADFTYGEWYFH
jgi:hypothetical protein